MKTKETKLIYLTAFSWKTVPENHLVRFIPVIDPTFLLLCHNYYILRNCAYVLTSMILLLFWKRNYMQSLNFQFCWNKTGQTLKRNKILWDNYCKLQERGKVRENIAQLLLGVWIQKKKEFIFTLGKCSALSGTWNFSAAGNPNWFWILKKKKKNIFCRNPCTFPYHI